MADYSRAGKIQRLASQSGAPQTRSEDVERAHKTMFDSGLAIRRAVAGDKYVDKALETYSSDFSRPMQEYVTEACWHSIWGRPGLERKTRSLLNIAMLCAQNRGMELATHVRGAVNNGASEVEIRETILQAACYCGMPAGIEGFRVAEKVLNDMKAEKSASQDEARMTGSSGPAGLGTGQPGTSSAPVTIPEARAQPHVEGDQSLNPS